MASLGKEEDTLAMNVAASLPSSRTTGDHLSAELHSLSRVDTMAWRTKFSEHAWVEVDASLCFPSSSKSDLTLSNGYGIPTSSGSTSCLGTYTVHADMHSPASPSSTCEYKVGAPAPHSVLPYSLGALSTPVNNLPDATLPAPFSLQSVTSGSGMLRHTFMCNYLNTLLPALRRIHSQSFSSSFDEKLSAVKLAANMSLAVSVGNSNTWSQALLKEVESSSAFMSLSCTSKARSRRKPARKLHRKLYFSKCSVSSAIRKRVKSRSFMHAWVLEKENYVARTDGSPISSPSAGYLSDCSVDVVHTPQWPIFPEKARQAWPHFLDLKKSPHHRGLSRYLRILRSTRTKKQRYNKASYFTHKDAIRAPSPVITKEHIESLGGLVPGGRNMDVPLLLQEAADYIFSLQMQVEVLQSLSQLVPL